MIRCNQIKASQQILLLLKNDLVDVIQEMDPLFLGQMWKLSLVLHGFDRRAPQLQAVSTVLGSMRLYSQIRHGRESPPVAILNCVLGVEEADFRTTMQLGFRESLKALEDKVIRKNMVLLKLWSTYAQYFCKPYVKPLLSTPAPPPKYSTKAARHCASVSEPHKRVRDHIQGDIMLLKFNQVWQQCYNPEKLPPSQWRQSSVCLRISHHYAYAAFWVCGEPDLAENMARNVIEHTQPDLTPHPVWNSSTMAFTVARKIIATIQQ
ncbi:uncharacterized protein B0J16DRAFT_410355 [Fusarium flagelliforme]|uniref:uncharacterized protein n=1 Tax=Fusarium flagelliforme TaxID=2675880 RepID=UPI001E8D7FEC|nr:uncharacterized protein B0J16DRAFT_410355 [Fusarium flagelliforme]KAH7198901.1 hypothetical protein B0J16DRAFT_410355 [Fusarium flagelliforme]